MDSDDCSGEKIYFYKLILDRKIYMDMIKEMDTNGYATMSKEKIFSTQDIQIFESGHIHIVH